MPDFRRPETLDLLLMLCKNGDALNTIMTLAKNITGPSLHDPIVSPCVRECARCHKHPATVLNKPCNHRWLCGTCTCEYREANDNTCPICHKQAEIDIIEETDPTTQDCAICSESWESNYMLKVTDGCYCDHYLCVGCMTRSYTKK